MRQEPSPYRLIFYDHFDRPTIDNNKWFVNNGNILIENSILKLGSVSTSVNMQQRHCFQYGYVEIYAKLGGTKTNENSSTSLLWLYPAKDNPRYEEIDLTETSAGSFNIDKTSIGINKMNVHIHSPLQPIATGFMYNTNIDLSSNFHKYAFDWTNNFVIFYFDDIEVGRINYSRIEIPRGRLQIVFSLCRKSDLKSSTCWPSTVYPPTEDAYLYIDYIKIYQKM